MVQFLYISTHIGLKLRSTSPIPSNLSNLQIFQISQIINLSNLSNPPLPISKKYCKFACFIAKLIIIHK